MALASVRRDEGQTFTEYAIIVATITVGVVAAVGTLRDAVITAITTVAGDI
jgi:Flp pilus assembly pilin Flp